MPLERKFEDVNFKLHFVNADGSKSKENVTQQDIDDFCNDFNIDSYAPGRISTLFKFEVLSLSKQGINPKIILEEISNLESAVSISRTKPETVFNHPPLKGLHHKHFLPNSVSSIAINMDNGAGGDKGRRKIIENLIKESGETVFTEDLIKKIIKSVTTEPFKARSDQNKLTGEWIIYLPYQDQNYYLSACKHSTNEDPRDEKIYSNIDTVVFREWPELKTHLQAINS
ncbi:hypothetical protein BVG18_00405 [Acinetobacter lwoffii]|jgi:hypothetical protein|uniref:hypothetical protein n=1 Tax=Acinetobacter lwoffii TaxID=28090 RepID=UPI000A3219E3|nr:hypothetical protein BVG18_00405 [Acinetobacter lwoffii]